jgi:probable phosphoglycerate mutase
VDVDDRFAEVHFGQWEGLTAAQVEETWPGSFAAWHLTGTFAPPGGESYADVATRVWHGLEDLVTAGVGRTVAVAGHAVQIRAAVGTAIGAPPAQWHMLRIPPASVTILQLWADGTAELTALGVPDGI